MRTLERTLRRLAGITSLVALGAVWAPPVHAQEAGRIVFSGALVAPPFEIFAHSARGAAATADVASARGVQRDATVSFVAPPGSSPNAHLALTQPGSPPQGSRPGPQAVPARLFDHAGRQLRADANGSFKLDGRGTVLALEPVSAGTPLIVVVSYN